MAKTIALLILVMMNVAVVAQSSYTVIYRLKMNVDSNGKSVAPEIVSALYVLGDTMTVYKMAKNEKELMKKMDLRNRDAYHGTMNMMKGGKHYEVKHLPKEDYYVEMPNSTTKWEIMPNDTITILNKKCVAAKIKDFVVWYAPSMPLRSGPMEYYGLPGLVLAVYVSGFNFICTAEKIIPSVPEIKSTGDLKILSQEAFTEMQKRNAQKTEKKGIRWFGL